MTKKFSDERRTFLKAVALLSGAAACLTLERKAIAEPKLPRPEEKSVQGYTETDHIRKYYQAARI